MTEINKNDPVNVRFFNLIAANAGENGTFGHKSVCPSCYEGTLMMHRNSDTGELMAEDVCTLCGQRFVYDDIEKIRKERP